MKKTLLLLFLINSLVGYTQNNLQVHYLVTYNTFKPTTKKAILTISNELSFYIEGKDMERKVDDTSTDGEIFVQYKASKTFNVAYSKIDSLYSKVNLKGQDYLLGEQRPSLDWHLNKIEKVVDNYRLRQATLNFRGRDYIAWYSEDIPTTAGPWKFSGLPGLIFEIYDSTNRYVWQLSKIINIGSKIDTVPSCKSCPKIDLKEFCYLSYEKKTDNSMVLRNLPRGTTVTSTRPARNGKEIKFEWEEK